MSNIFFKVGGTKPCWFWLFRRNFEFLSGSDPVNRFGIFNNKDIQINAIKFCNTVETLPFFYFMDQIFFSANNFLIFRGNIVLRKRRIGKDKLKKEKTKKK